MMDLGTDAAGALAGGDDGQGGAGSAGGADVSGGAGGGGDSGGGEAAGGADESWLEAFSADPADANAPSNRDWLKAKGFKDLDGLVKSYRDTEKTLRSGDKVVVPGDDAKPEDLAAFRKAIGVPETVDGYELAAPDGHELDPELVGPMRDAALKAGVPAKAFAALGQAMMAKQLDDLNQQAARQKELTSAVMAEWGEKAQAKIAAGQRAMTTLELSADDAKALQTAWGSDRVLKLFARLGEGLAEDTLIGSGKQRFGVTGAEAQTEINSLSADAEFYKKLVARDPAAVARWDRLNAAVAAERDAKERAER